MEKATPRSREEGLPTGQDELIEIHVTGGPPWGFNIRGGSDFGKDLIVGKVSVCCALQT